MGLESRPPKMSTLNPNASEFVPAARRVVVEESKAPVSVASPTALEEFSNEWWSRLEIDEGFRAQCMSRFSAEERDAFAEDFAELADYDQFEGYQEHLVDLEEEELLAHNLQQMDCFLDEDLSLTGSNGVEPHEQEQEKQEQEKQEKQLQQQRPVPWSKNPSYYQNKTMPHKG